MLMVAAGISGALALAGSAAAGTHSTSDGGNQPPGNNGTIKIHRTDTEPEDHANEPHVGCEFTVEFFGFDGYANSSEMSFSLWSPTQPDQPTLYTRHVDLTVDNRVSGAEWDHEETFTAAQIIGTNDVEPQPQQGYHVKLTVETDDSASQGATVKHKVFWMQPCETATSTTTTMHGTTTTTMHGTTTTTAAGGNTTTTTAAGGNTTTSVAAGGNTTTTIAAGGNTTTTTTTATVGGTTVVTPTAGPSVLGESITNTQSPAASGETVAAAPSARAATHPETSVLGSQLARTGAPVAGLAGVGGLLVAAGYALTRTNAARREEQLDS
jgi:hypothetical protein